MTEPTTFILGAGFSAEQQFPLVRGLTGRVIHFLEAEQHSSYKGFLRDTQGLGHAQFYEGLHHLHRERQLGFEELLIGLPRHLAMAPQEDPCHVTSEVLRIGVARLLWCITSFIWRVESCYQHFAQRLISAKGTWRVVTFNWDILVEQAIEQSGGAWAYSIAASGSAVPIIKPHGSINWSSHLQNPNLTPIYPDWAPVGPGSKLSFDRAHPLSNQDQQEINSDLRYCLYPGDPDLPTTNPDLRLLWSDVTAAIKQSERVVFIGYSLPAYDSFAGNLFRELCAAKIVDVYDPSAETRKRFEDALPHACCYDTKFNATPYALRL